MSQKIEQFSRHELGMMVERSEGAAKDYIKQYFFKVLEPTCIYFLNTDTEQFSTITYQDFAAAFVTSNLVYHVIEGKQVKYIKYSDWFKNIDRDSYHISFDFKQPRQFTQSGRQYINLFRGYTYSQTEQPNITTDIQSKIDKIWGNINDVICSGNKPAYEYMKKWICHMVTGRKMKTALYLKGPQGIGKSSLATLLTLVVGEHTVYTTQTNSCLVGRFNGELIGVTLAVFEELKCSTPSEWSSMSSVLKAIITEPRISIEQKGKDAFNIHNLLSVIICSNDNVIKMDLNDRRYLMTDVSPKKMGDKDYWNELYSIYKDKNVICSFYHDCLEYAKNNPFDELPELRDIETESKTEAIIKNLHPFYVYIKEEYVLKNRDFDVYLKQLCEDYNSTSKHKIATQEVQRYLKDIDVNGKPSTGNRFRYIVSHKSLHDIFLTKRWIDKCDEMECDDNVDEEELKALNKDGYTDAALNRALIIARDKIDAQAREIEELKAELLRYKMMSSLMQETERQETDTIDDGSDDSDDSEDGSETLSSVGDITIVMKDEKKVPEKKEPKPSSKIVINGIEIEDDGDCPIDFKAEIPKSAFPVKTKNGNKRMASDYESEEMKSFVSNLF